MNHYSTFESQELKATLAGITHNLHQAMESVVYFQQYARIHGVDHDFVVKHAMEHIGDAMHSLNLEFGIETGINALTEEEISKIVDQVNRDHGRNQKK